MRFIWAIAIQIILTSTVPAQEGSKQVFTVDDHFKLGYLFELAMSPDGSQVAYTEGRWQEATNDRRTDIWLVNVDGNTIERLTHDRAGYDSLRWSSDGKYIYFASQAPRAGETVPPYDGSRQVWRLGLNDRALEPVTRQSGGMAAYDLSSDSKSIVYTSASDEEDESEWHRLHEQFAKVKYGTRKFSRTTISKVDLANWRTTEVARFKGAVDAFRLSPDGTRLAMVTAPNDAVITMEGKSEVTILTLDDGDTFDLPNEMWRKESRSAYGRVGRPEWSMDSSALAFTVGFDAYPSQVFIANWDGDRDVQIRMLDRPGNSSLHGGVDGGSVLAWRGDSHDLCFLGDDKARVKIYRKNNALDGGEPAVDMTPGDAVVDNFSWDLKGNRVAAIYGKPDTMSNIYVLAEGTWRQVTDINAHVKRLKLPKLSIVSWKGAGGAPVEGVLELPPDHTDGDRLPLVVNLHGGPTAAWNYSLLSGFTGSVLLASQGYAFFSPNYRGSTGYGDQFITDLINHENEVEVEDILLGVDMLVDKGIVDPDRMAVAGWSNGGYLTNCLITKTNRFKAASSGAGIVDLVTEWGTSDEPAFPVVFLGGTPFQVPDAYQRASPIWNFKNVRTPTLFHVGENDRRCPRGHSEMAFRALNDALAIDSELLVYPGEQHGLSKLNNRRAKMSWELAWFDHYLKGKPKP